VITIENIGAAIEGYENCYRHPNLKKIEKSEIYKLYPEEGEYGWPEGYPLGDKCGVYAICREEQILYIGKASQQPLSHRISSYFRYGEDRISCVTAQNHSWSLEPTVVVTWAVPEDSAFEASSLEEYLLTRFVTDLPDNKLGYRRQPLYLDAL